MKQIAAAAFVLLHSKVRYFSFFLPFLKSQIVDPYPPTGTFAAAIEKMLTMGARGRT